MYVAAALLNDRAEIHIYDPKVSQAQIFGDLRNLIAQNQLSIDPHQLPDLVKVYKQPLEACANAHAIAILTEWDEFKGYDWKKIYEGMLKPAFIFDGRNILDKEVMNAIGYKVYQVGK